MLTLTIISTIGLTSVASYAATEFYDEAKNWIRLYKQIMKN